MSPRRKAENELTKEHILEAAKELFAESGYHQVSMRALARKLECSHGALYYHYDNKASLFTALIEKGFSMLNERLDDIVADQAKTNQEKLLKIFKGFLQFGIDYPHHYEMMFQLKDDDLRHTVQASYESFQKFGVAVQSLVSTSLSQKEIWSCLVSLHGFVSYFIREGQSSTELEKMIDHHAEFLARALQ